MMKMKKINVTETIVADIQLHIVQNGSGGPVIFWGMYPHQGGEVEHFWEALMELVPEQNFLLVAFQVEDWNQDFSPWEAVHKHCAGYIPQDSPPILFHCQKPDCRRQA